MHAPMARCVLCDTYYYVERDWHDHGICPMCYDLDVRLIED